MALQALQSSGVAFRKILSHFPEELSLAFAYGSGVYRQAGPSSDQKNAMLDFVFTVDDPVAWHSKNLKKNWNHYSFLKVLGPRIITAVQNNYGAGVYYNPLITCDGRLIKYGVISTSVLIEDLLNWNNLYIAGRLQKPIDKSPEGQFTQLMTLPKTLQQQINHIMDPPGKNRDVEETLLQVAHDPDCGDVVRLGLAAIVRPSSMRQSTKGIFTAGFHVNLKLQDYFLQLRNRDNAYFARVIMRLKLPDCGGVKLMYNISLVRCSDEEAGWCHGKSSASEDGRRKKTALLKYLLLSCPCTSHKLHRLPCSNPARVT